MGYPHLVLNAWIELVEDRDWVLSFQLHPVVQVAAGARVAPLRRRPVGQSHDDDDQDRCYAALALGKLS